MINKIPYDPTLPVNIMINRQIVQMDYEQMWLDNGVKFRIRLKHDAIMNFCKKMLEKDANNGMYINEFVKTKPN